jgi:uncharacterized membrane protein YfcA
MELTVATIIVAIIGIPLLSIVMDPVTAGGLLAPLFVASDLVALRYWKSSTWSKPDLLLLLPGLVVGIGLGYLLFRVLDHRAISIVMAVTTLIFVGLWFAAGANVTIRPRSPPKAVAAGLTSGITTMVAHSGGPPLAMYLLPLGLSKEVYAGTTSLFFTVGNIGAMAAAVEAGRQHLDRDGNMPARHSCRCLAWLAASRKAGSASAL